MRILGISGSLRRDSYNTATLRAAIELAPRGVSIARADISDLPLYDDDLRARGFPAPVARLRRQIAEADALLLISPEYNYSVSGVLKNALDWASRPPDPPCAGKAAAVTGASPGLLGTARAQYHLRQICVYLDLHVLSRPEVMIMKAAERFRDGELVHEPTRELLRELVASLCSWTERLAARRVDALGPAPPAGPRVDPRDEVEEASYESFPASDPPSYSPRNAG